MIGAIFLGPRIGKYVTGADGKKEARAIPGHSLTLGALGVFILWFGWYGFNGAAAGDAVQLAEIFGTTTIGAVYRSQETRFNLSNTWFCPLYFVQLRIAKVKTVLLGTHRQHLSSSYRKFLPTVQRHRLPRR